jgi:hypothetical protein
MISNKNQTDITIFELVAAETKSETGMLKNGSRS